MSPFETEVARLSAFLTGLGQQAQVAFLAAAARSLMPRYLDWIDAVGASDCDVDTLEKILNAAEDFAIRDVRTPLVGLLASSERGVPEAPSEVAGFTSAQDCWICADSAIRVALDQYQASDAMWFVLEPLFQATSERLFGLSDVGSDRQLVDEARALKDLSLGAGITAIEDVCRKLSSATRVTSREYEECVGSLAAIRP